MIGEIFLSVTLGEILGLVVTVVGIWLIVMQLNGERLASQMTGMLTLLDHWREIIADRQKVLAMTSRDGDWDKLNAKDAYKSIFRNSEATNSFIRVANFFDTVGLLVRSKALDKRLAFRGWGIFLTRMYDQFEKVILFDRRAQNNHTIYEDWEWLAGEYKKSHS